MDRPTASTMPMQPRAAIVDTTSQESPFLARWLLWAIAGVILLCIFGVAAFYWKSNSKNELNMEFAKAGIQIGIISLAGTALSFLVSRYETRLAAAQREREERAATDQRAREQDVAAARTQLRYREEFLKDILKRITASYNKSKGARRMVRAELVPDLKRATHVRTEAYRKFIAELNDAQLEFEAVKRDLKTSRDGGFPSDELGVTFARCMEKHLNHIVDQYEKFRSTQSNQIELPLKEVDKFAAFVNPNSNKDFKENYATLHSAMRRMINKELLLLASGMTAKAASVKRKQEADAGADQEEEDELD